MTIVDVGLRFAGESAPNIGASGCGHVLVVPIGERAAARSCRTLSLGLAIGACTAAFSLIDALILRDLPVHDPSGLAYVSRAGNNKDLRFSALFSYPFLESMRHTLSPRMEVFSIGYQSVRAAILPDAGGAEEKVRAQFVSGNAFNVLGVAAAIGRVLQPSDDLTPGAHPVAVISHGFWSRRFGANPGVLGHGFKWTNTPTRSWASRSADSPVPSLEF